MRHLRGARKYYNMAATVSYYSLNLTPSINFVSAALWLVGV